MFYSEGDEEEAPQMFYQDEGVEGRLLIDIHLLIQTIQNYEYLYNMSNKNYKNNKKKEIAWQELASTLNATVDDIMRVWRNLRDRFVKEKKKKSEDIRWPYYEAMLFYSKYTKRRRSNHSSFKPKEENNSRPSSSASAWSDQEIDINTMDDETPSASKGFTPVQNKVLQIKAKGDSSRDSAIAEVFKMAKTIVSTEKNTCADTNPNRTFADYVCSRLQEMSSTEAKKMRKRILLVLEDIQSGDIPNQT